MSISKLKMKFYQIYKMKYGLLVILVISLLIQSSGGYFQSDRTASLDDDKSCFCELKGSIDDCSCNVDAVDHYNNVKIYPRLKSLLVKDFFRFYKVNLRGECPFWADDSKCAMKFCHVQACEESDIPAGLKGAFNSERPSAKYMEEYQTSKFSDCGNDLDAELGYLNTSISDKAQHEFRKWADYDEAQDNFCILDDNEEGAEHVDLLLNPERYTGYKGESAHRIWRNIYLENCFLSDKLKKNSNFISYRDLGSWNDICLEQRAFYRLVSGLHSSINIHLSANFLLSEKKNFVSPNGVWGLNIDEFIQRFSPETTDNEGPNWLRNLYFTYIIELRAIAKAAPYLRNELFFTGNKEQDMDMKNAIDEFLGVIESFPSHFDESQMFMGPASVKLKYEFREKFRNISKIMDCVGCDKCRLWGKLQTQGLGTALKILFSGKFDTNHNMPGLPIMAEMKQDDKNFRFKLTRTEIVALFNAFGRLSNSIHFLEKFRQQLR